MKIKGIFKKGCDIISNVRKYFLMPDFYSLGENHSFDLPFNIMGAEFIEIGHDFVARRNLKLRAFSAYNVQQFTPHIFIGDNVSIETDCHIGCINKVKICSNVLIASGVFISDHMHGLNDYSDIEVPPNQRKLSSKGPIIVEEGVWIGERAVILAGVTIGKNSIIAANAVVTEDVEPFTIVGGVPAKILKRIR